MTWLRICAGVFMPLVKIDFVSAINLLMEGKVIAYYRIKMPWVTKWREKGRILEIKIPVANIQGYVYSGTHPLFLFLILV
jgi:hypothetical protein